MVINSPYFGMKIVVIDDDPNSLDVAQILLQVKGADVTTAINGREGLDLIETIKPQLIISDLSMPVMDGWNLLKHLQQIPELNTIPVIALTAHAMAGDREKVLKAGFYGYLSKPLNPGTFTDDLQSLLQNHSLFTSKEGLVS